MNLPENDFQILKLSDAFYNAYPNPPYVEILKKKRAYNCILFQTHYDYYICVPYRTEVSHVAGRKVLQQQEFKRRYQYSPLKYFHKGDCEEKSVNTNLL